MRNIILFIYLLSGLSSFAQPGQKDIDVLQYYFKISVNDRSDTLQGQAAITVKMIKPLSQISLDLSSLNDSGRGMSVASVSAAGRALQYEHKNNILKINFAALNRAGSIVTVHINYSGVPADGLIFSVNQYGQRTVFSDNWPDRAHNWLPCSDHPADKAAVIFEITAPDHYQVVANGLCTVKKAISNHMRITRWKETADLPTKVMAIGIARFAVGSAGKVANIPVSSWVFPQNRQAGFYDYGKAAEILPFFIKKIGPYPYRKLANVQSKTRFGGMENASAIFYAENSISGKGNTEDLLAHEIAHQWFGNSVTETAWQHIWLSEGFATYMADCYLEHKYGTDTLAALLKAQRNKVIGFSKTTGSPVVNELTGNYMQLLNANSYEKGGWVLHMLRRKLGDKLFWEGIAAYYKAFRGTNADTEDLKRTFENISGLNLDVFFNQWLFQPEHPLIDVVWQYNAGNKTVKVTVQQKGRIMNFPLELALFSGGSYSYHKVNISAGENSFDIPVRQKPLKLVADPHTDLLFEAHIKEQ